MDSTNTNIPEPVEPEIGTKVAAEAQTRFPCKGCGAQLTYAPGTTSLKCPYCSFDNPIAASDSPIVEHDFLAALDALESAHDTTDRLVSHCDSCGANVQFPANVTSLSCPFCGRDVVAARASTKLIKPHALLPFNLDERAARERYRKWLRSLWFAPSTLKDFATLDTGLVGVYLPYWTYDCEADTNYSGMRGDDYWVTETYTTTVNGRPTIQTRQVRRTRWTPVAGRVHNRFNDVLVNASGSIREARAEQLEPWDLESVTPYADEYLAGFRAESYALGLKDGFGVARQRMEPEIESTIRGDIGGDHQRITGKQSRYDDITFKHILLPVWTSAYRYHGKVYSILVNARTGEVIGERPWSAWKITGLVLAILGAIIAILLITTIANR
ncbi:MAG: hypothetical protein SFY96_02055 [Planctomycetota bacterium]|nr:hypothetical protein [Planctomycetota bacterium]